MAQYPSGREPVEEFLDQPRCIKLSADLLGVGDRDETQIAAKHGAAGRDYVEESGSLFGEVVLPWLIGEKEYKVLRQRLELQESKIQHYYFSCWFVARNWRAFVLLPTLIL